MSSSAPEAQKPRRKWGWLFVVAFVIQAIVFSSIILTAMADRNRARSFQSDLIRRGNLTMATGEQASIQILDNRVNLGLIGFGVCSALTIAGMVLGFRRKT